MKRIDIFCASQASTAICMSMDQPSSSSATTTTTTISLGGKAIDRHNPIIRDQKRTPRPALPLAPCTSQSPPINPQPYYVLHKIKKDKNDNSLETSSKAKTTNDQNKKSSRKSKQIKKDKNIDEIDGIEKDVVRKSWAKRGDFITPPGSSRYLLSEKDFLDGLLDYDPVLALVPTEPNKRPLATNQQEPNSSSSTSKSSNSTEKPSNQVVVLRVSLHCKGCEGKVRKHLSRMEGVRSYSIDFAAKKVTIEGDVTPLSVLASVSKVKNAQFWVPATAPPAVSNNSLNK